VSHRFRRGARERFAKSLDKSNPLCTIADLSSVWAVGDVYEKDLASLRVGDSAEAHVSAYPAEPSTAPITAIGSRSIPRPVPSKCAWCW